VDVSAQKVILETVRL